MAVPTFTSISPDEGHTGGILVVITGTNFRVADTGEHVRVRFEGGPNSQIEDATHVEVWSSTEIRCMTPRLDPSETSTVFTADAGTDTLTAASHGLSNGTLVQLVAEDGESLPAPLSEAVPYFVANATTNTFQLSASDGGSTIDLTDVGSGTLTAKSDSSFDIRITNLDDDDVEIPGEEVLATDVFRPIRPDLTGTGYHLSETIRAFILELRRQIIPNVTWTVHTDYDEETGTVEFAFPSTLPALVIAELDLSENRSRGTTSQEDLNHNDVDSEGDFITFRRGVLIDVSGNLLGVSDNSIELLNFAQATRVFFQKNDKLRVTCPDGTVIEYQMRASRDMTISPLEENTNVQWFTLPFRIVAVRVDQIPGLPNKTIPGAPTNVATEAIIGSGKTAQIDLETFEGIELVVEAD